MPPSLQDHQLSGGLQLRSKSRFSADAVQLTKHVAAASTLAFVIKSQYMDGVIADSSKQRGLVRQILVSCLHKLQQRVTEFKCAHLYSVFSASVVVVP